MTREAALTAFVTHAGWSDAVRHTVAGDASNRRYERLTRATGDTAILMDAPPDKGEGTEPFLRIATLLVQSGLSAPRIYHQDANQGLLLLEDLGSDLFYDLMQKDVAKEHALYHAAIDVLHRFAALPTQQLQPCNADWLCAATDLFFEWYVQDDAHEAQESFKSVFHPMATMLDREKPVFIHRDFHAQNLLWLPARRGPARVGLIDFQDALRGHPAYDLVSLLQDARRDVSTATETAGLAYYLAHSDHDPLTFSRAYALLGLQRNLRILGIFTRLCLRDGKAHYVDMIPRVWGYVMRNLMHPDLGELAEIMKPLLSKPDSIYLTELKSKCATLPKP